MKLDYSYKPKRTPEDFGWHSRGKLPHLDADEFCQFVTFRLHDSMPQTALDEWRKTATTDAQFRKKIERYLDAGFGECWLKKSEIAQLVTDALKFYDGQKYNLISWVLMPNHGHILFQQLKGHHLPEIMHSIKSFTANKANKILDRTGQFWQHESFDRYIRDRRHLAAVVNYIEQNPVKAGLCDNSWEWKYSSAFERRDNFTLIRTLRVRASRDACRSSRVDLWQS